MATYLPFHVGICWEEHDLASSVYFSQKLSPFTNVIIYIVLLSNRQEPFSCTDAGQTYVNVWWVLAQYLQLPPSCSATPLSSQVHWLVLTTYSTPMKGTICHFFSCLKVMIQKGTLGNLSPLPVLLALFSFSNVSLPKLQNIISV